MDRPVFAIWDYHANAPAKSFDMSPHLKNKALSLIFLMGSELNTEYWLLGWVPTTQGHKDMQAKVWQMRAHFKALNKGFFFCSTKLLHQLFSCPLVLKDVCIFTYELFCHFQCEGCALHYPQSRKVGGKTSEALRWHIFISSLFGLDSRRVLSPYQPLQKGCLPIYPHLRKNDCKGPCTFE